MKLRLPYLFPFFFCLMVLVQCSDSVIQSTDEKGEAPGKPALAPQHVSSQELPPQQVEPQNKADDVSVRTRFEWKAVEGADKYILHASQGNQMVIETQLEGTGYIHPENLRNETTYYWRVRAVQNGIEGNWSEIHSFTTSSVITNATQVQLISPGDGAQVPPTTLRLEWAELDEITDYQLQLTNHRSFNAPVADEVVSETSYEASGLANDQTYYWRVQAVGDGDSENWSAVRSVTTGERGNTDAGVTVSDRQALMDLYESTGGDRWHNNSGWGSSAPLNSWHGIATDGQGRVIRVDLFQNNLRGQLPASIGQLDEVTYINVKFNYLTGTIPSSIGNMSSLKTLILAGRTYDVGGTVKEPPEDLVFSYHPGKYVSATNNFSGTIPSTAGNLSNLEFLEIANQQSIIGPIPSEIGNLSNLKGLYLSLNDFSGTTIPSSLGNLTNLRHLYIAASQLEGEIPSSLSNLTLLTSLNLGELSNHTPDNHLTGTVPDFSASTDLRSFIITDNNLTGEYPHYWNNGNFTEMHTLRYSWNNFTGTLHGFENLPYMKSFGVEGNNLTGSIDKLTTVPHNIRIIGVGWNNFSGDFPQSGWPDFTEIKTLYINDNNLTGNIPCSFWSKLDNPKLGIAWIGGTNNFSDTCPSGKNAMQGNGNIR